ncbi:Tetracycline resistance protein, class C [Roseobacter fucihabitans]|uniref:Tetracycline resistance protein, class C n=1 Tax=Roseobacter fucihabitans TaxID=1537242 RepID=A0ABZ2BVN0_9RHOB|nr:TCR/Tet family MFS transporter [Roseobacter litoralis]MBC6965024.1 Tetracycline resistance protein, class C [Roseobacter litoralis]
MRPAVVFIMLTVMLDAMGIGLIIPVMPDLIQEIQGTGLSNAALWGGVLSTTFAVMQFIFGPIIGGLSDRFGRRPILLTSLVVMALDYLLMAVAGSIALLLIGRIVGGITAATQSTANAYMADISRPEDRAANFGLVGAAFGLGFVLGPLLGGFLAEYGTRAPFYAAAALAALNALFGYFVLRETVTKDTQRPFRWARANPLGSIRQLGRLPGVGALLIVFFLYQVAFMVYPAIWAFFGKERFGWDPATIGLSLALFGIMLAIVQGGLIRPVLRLLGERGTVIYGHFFDIVAFLALAFVTNGTLALILTPLAGLAAVITPALQGIMSKAVAADAQGELQGALTSASALAMILSPMVMTSVFASFTSPEATVYLPGAPFILSAVLIAAGLAVFIAFPPRQSPNPKEVL